MVNLTRFVSGCMFHAPINRKTRSSEQQPAAASSIARTGSPVLLASSAAEPAIAISWRAAVPWTPPWSPIRIFNHPFEFFDALLKLVELCADGGEALHNCELLNDE